MDSSTDIDHEKRLSLSDLPPEIFIEIVSSVEYDDATFHALRRTSKHLREVLDANEHTIVRKLLRKYAPNAVLEFPGIAPREENGQTVLTFEFASRVSARRETIQALLRHKQTVDSRGYFGDYIIRVALLLLYRMGDLGSHEVKHDYISALDLNTLSILILFLYIALEMAHAGDVGAIMHSTLRYGLERHRWAFEPLLHGLILREGPEFFRRVLDGAELEKTTLLFEYERIQESQLAEAQGNLPPPTLYNTLKAAYALQSSLRRQAAIFDVVDWIVKKSPREVSENELWSLLTFPKEDSAMV